MSFKDLYYMEGKAGREDLQIYWHNFIIKYIKDSIILDVGSGQCGSKERLEKANNKVFLQEPAPNLNADFKKDIGKFESDSYEYITSFDVIEHVPKDEEFLGNLFRVCQKGVFIATPNYWVSGNRNPYHIREYTPPQLVELCKKFSDKLKFFSDAGPGIELEWFSEDTGQSHKVLKIVELTEEQFLNTPAPHLGVILYKEKQND
jgi:hypothetical protein